MLARDVVFKDLGTAFPEQHYAYDQAGNLIGYVRVRWGYCSVYCPDAGSNDEVYNVQLQSGFGEFGSNNERKKNLRKAKACIAAWCNNHPGVYGVE